MPIRGVPLSSASVFAKDGYVSTQNTNQSSFTATLTSPTHLLASFQSVLGCTLFQHPTSHAPVTNPPLAPKRARLWGVHWHHTGWRLIAAPLDSMFKRSSLHFLCVVIFVIYKCMMTVSTRRVSTSSRYATKPVHAVLVS